MATPTSSTPLNPSSASKRVAGHVSTPSHLGFSPAPRSVPSPAATRKEHAGKTPVNHPTTSSHGSKTLGGTPMIHSLSQQGITNGSSPGAHTLSFGTPLGLGVEGITPGTFNMPTPGMAALPMSFTISELGVASGVTAPKRNEDEERRVKMRRVLKSIGKPKGRVSEEAMARISRMVGFDLAIDHETPEERVKNASLVGNRSFDIAGKKILLEVTLKDQRPEDVTAAFATENAGLHEQAQAVGKVLLDDLRDAGEVLLSASLDRFAANLERLASIDCLSTDHFDSFEALSGIYTSLRRLYDQEVTATSEIEVVRRRSGKPVVHADGQIGFKIAYWDADRFYDDSKKGDDVIGLFTLGLRIERSSAGIYPSVRVSDQWLQDPLELSTTELSTTIPWQEPLPTLILASTNEDAMVVDSEPKLPDLRFTAKLDPPVVLPWQVATSVLQSVGLPAPQLVTYPPAWHAMAVDPSGKTPFNLMAARVMVAEKSVLVMKGGEETEITHAYVLDVAKPDGGYKLERLPFAHPRQLVELLPTLRQWACLGSLVKSLFAGDSRAAGKLGTTSVTGTTGNGIVKRNAPIPISLNDLLTPPTTPPSVDRLAVSVSLATSPVPILSFIFSTAMDRPVCNVIVQVLQNGVLSVIDTEGFTDDAGTEVVDDATSKRLSEALEACGDLGVWLEWTLLAEPQINALRDSQAQISIKLSAKMCYTITKYHTICHCFGKTIIAGEPCIRALASSLSRCWDTTDLGIENEASLCPRCAKGISLSPELVGDHDHNPQLSRMSSHTSVSSQGSSAPGVELLEKMKRVTSNMSLSSMANERYHTSPNPSGEGNSGQGREMGDLERMAFCLPGADTASASDSSPTGQKSWNPENLHWRTFGGSEASVKFKRGAS
ncbi:hypothetical protein LTR29_003285 [Friedmanniomyces endolithicus]|nr:hypothetical protein LTR29_003285 [Friedmanniomyces endolithicus]